MKREWLRDFLNNQDILWLNIFLRDVFLIFVVGMIQFMTKFNSKFVWFITGMLLVWITWHLSDYLNSKRRLV